MAKTDANTATAADFKYDSPVLVGCDDGFAAVKLAFFNGGQLQQIMIPSRAAVGANLTAQTTGGDSDATYHADDVTYTVSEHLKAQDTRFQSYPTSALNRVLVHHALRKAGLGGMRVCIATGLPPGNYYRGDGLNQRLISGKQRNLLARISTGDREPVATIIDHHVFSEAASGLVDYCVGLKGETLHEVTEPIAVVDIGGRTTDCLTILPPGNQVDQTRSGTANMGVLDVMDVVRAHLCDAFDLEEVSDQRIDQAIRTGSVQLFGKSQSVRAAVDNAIREVSEKILRYVQTRFTNAAEVETIIFVGGGAELMRAVIEEFPQAHVPETPQFANARGMLKYMMLMAAAR